MMGDCVGAERLWIVAFLTTMVVKESI